MGILYSQPQRMRQQLQHSQFEHDEELGFAMVQQLPPSRAEAPAGAIPTYANVVAAANGISAQRSVRRGFLGGLLGLGRRWARVL